MKRQLMWATAVMVATLAAACNGAQDSAGLSPTAPSAASGQAAGSGGLSLSGLTAAQAAELTTACGLGSGDRVTNGTPPAGGAPPGAITGGPGGLGPGDRVTNGTPPSGPPAAGTQLAIGGAVEGLSGSCPSATFSINGKTLRTNATTSFGSGSCSSLTNGARVGAMGTAQGDGSVVASCVAGL